MDRRKDGQFVARFKEGGSAAMGRSKEKVAQRIVEHMDPNNKRNTRNNDIDRYVDWRSTLILKETSNVDVENDDDDSEQSIQAEKNEILQRVQFTPEKQKGKNRNKNMYRASYKKGGGRAAAGTQSEIADSLIAKNIDWRNEITLN